MENSKKRKLVIIGIDGGTFNIIDPLINKGGLPNLKKLIDSGVKGILNSTYPPITAAAWVSFMTGKNPGKHGFFDFRNYDPAEYDLFDTPIAKDAVSDDISALHASRFQGQTIWDFFGEAGFEVNVVAVPMTYPPWKVNGRMVPGYPSPDYARPKTYPAEWGEKIGRIFNMSAINYSKLEDFIRECKDLVKRKGKIILDQLKNRRGEVFAVVFSSSDFAQHYFWKYINQHGAYSTVIDEVYQEIDSVVGEIIDLVDRNTSICVISDHGFTGYPKNNFHLNAWLLQENYLSVKGRDNRPDKGMVNSIVNVFLNQIKYRKRNWRWFIKKIIDRMPPFIKRWASQHYYKSNLINWELTRAYRFKMYASVDGLVINQKGRQKKGVVTKGEEYENLRTEIINKLLLVKDPETGAQIVQAVFRREELFNGNYLKNAPDIVIQYSPNYMGGIELLSPIATLANHEETGESGVHDRNGIFILSGPNCQKGVEIKALEIIDVAPTILYDFSLQIPDDMDGEIIKTAFHDSYLRSSTPKYYAGKKKDEKKETGLSSEEEESMKDALKNLGYL